MADSTGGGKGMAIAAMVLGITAFFPGCCFWYAGVVLAILAIVLGVKAKGGPAAGMAKTGLVLGICAIVLYIIMVIVGANLGENMKAWAEKMQEEQKTEQNESDPDPDPDPTDTGN